MTMTEPQGRNQSVRRVVAASFIGTTIEWYDFFLYGTAAALVFNQLFFPDVRSARRHAGGLRHLRGRLRRPAARRDRLRPLRRPGRPQGDARADAAASWASPRSSSACCPPTRRSASGRRSLLVRAALRPGHRRRRRVGRRGADGGRARAPRAGAASTAAGRRWACPPACCCQPVVFADRPARCPRTQFLAWGWRDPVPAQRGADRRRPVHPAARCCESPAFAAASRRRGPRRRMPLARRAPHAPARGPAGHGRARSPRTAPSTSTRSSS